MQTKTGKFNVGEVNKVQVNKDFEFQYRVFDSYAEVQSSADWSEKNLLELVNSYEKSSAKANEYQEVTKPYRPDPNDPAVKREQSIANLVKVFNIPRAIAEQQIDAMINAQKELEAETVKA